MSSGCIGLQVLSRPSRCVPSMMLPLHQLPQACSLSFEDFLEAWVRVATMKAFPSPDELQEAGHDDAVRSVASA